jgi:hypothetical protein
MRQSRGKQIVYRYNGDPNTQQTISDLHGSMLPHLVGSIVNRDGKQWRVVSIHEELDIKGPLSVPIHHVFLTDAA